MSMSNNTFPATTSTAKVMIDFSLVNPDGMEIASELTSLVCITVLALALGAKTYGEKIKSLNYGRVLVILLYTLSWAFATTSIVVVSTNNSKCLFCSSSISLANNFPLISADNIVSCTLGMLACDFFYAGSKIAIYAW